MLESVWSSMYNWFTPAVIFVFLNLIIGTIAISNTFFSPKSTHHDERISNSEQSQKQSYSISRSPSILQKFKSLNLYNYFNDSESEICRIQQSEDLIAAAEFEEERIVSNLEQSHKQSFVSRSPSILQKIKSINIYNYFNDSEMETYRSQQRENVISAAENEEEQINSNSKQSFIPKSSSIHQRTKEEDEEEQSRPTMDEIYRNLKGIEAIQNNKTRSGTKPIRKMKRWESTKTGFGQFDVNDVAVESRRPATMRERKRVEEDDAEVDAKADDFINNFKQQLKLQRMKSVLRFKEKVKTGGG